MDHTLFNPDSWLDVAAYLVIGLPALVASAAAWKGQRRSELWQKISHETQSQVLVEVKNEHATNLRDDIDGLGDAIRSGFKDVRSEVSWLREELRTERLERIEGDRDRKAL